jgi:hypothetical protein
MTFQEAEKIYKELRAQHEAGKLSDATFEAEVGKLRLQDAQGRWWQIGVQTGEWYVHDGQKWNKAKPPVTPSEPVSAPQPDITAVLARPGAPTRPAAPKAEKAEPAKKESPPRKEAAPKKEGISALPARLFSAMPAGRGGAGLSRNALIGIIAGVAVVCVILAIGGYALLQSGAGGQVARVNTPTPTRGLALPTLPPSPTLVRPTDTPLPPPTPVVTATLALPPTPTVARPVVARTPTRTPTRAPQLSPTPSAPPGVYVLKLETVPPSVDIGAGPVKVGFKLTLLNSTGTVQTRKKWFVRVFAAPEQTTGDTAFRNSYGESLKLDVNIGTGTVEITTPEHVQFGPGRCTYVAVPYYTDENNVAVPFKTLQGNPLYHSFKVCQ